MQDLYTLITGSSSGIGKAIANECASRGKNIILTSRPGERLDRTFGELKSRFNVKTECFAVDLLNHDAPRKLYEWCKEKDLKVNCIINNAGITGTIPFDYNDQEYIDSIVMVNIRALTLLTHYFLGDLKKIPGSKIVNIGSMSGFFPIPYKGIYSASKAYVHSFSMSLASELKGTGVKVFLSAPNGISSNPEVMERIKTHNFAGRIVSLTPEEYAKSLIDSIERGKIFHIPLLTNRLLFWLSRILPDRYIAYLLRKEFSKELDLNKRETDH